MGDLAWVRFFPPEPLVGDRFFFETFFSGIFFAKYFLSRIFSPQEQSAGYTSRK